MKRIGGKLNGWINASTNIHRMQGKNPDGKPETQGIETWPYSAIRAQHIGRSQLRFTAGRHTF